MNWNGADGLRDLLVPIGEVEPHPRNPRRGRVTEIAASLARFGQLRPVLLSGSTIVAGNHTFLAARSIGWTHIAAVQNEFAGEEEARAYLLADNRLPELGAYDQSQLLALLEELDAGEDGWQGTGYTLDDLEDLRALHDGVTETAPEPFRGGFAAGDAELARRQAELAAGREMHELVLMLDDAESAAFDSHVRILRKEFGGDLGITETVLRAVSEEARKVNQS